MVSCAETPGILKQIATRPLAGGRRKGGWGRPVFDSFSHWRGGEWGGGAREDRALPDGGLLGARGGRIGGSPRSSCSGGDGQRRRRRSGEVEAAWSSRGASPRPEGAIGGVDLGREKTEEGARR